MADSFHLDHLQPFNTHPHVSYTFYTLNLFFERNFDRNYYKQILEVAVFTVKIGFLIWLLK